MIEQTQTTMPYFYLIKYILFPFIPCIITIILFNFGNSEQDFNYYNLIYIYGLSLTSAYFSEDLVYFIICFPQIIEFFPYYLSKFLSFTVLQLDSDSETSSVYSYRSFKRPVVIINNERDRLNSSLYDVEKEMERCFKKITNLNN